LNRDTLRVTDYKTGRVPEELPVSVGGGEALQPLLYAVAVERLLGKPVERGALFYTTGRGGLSDRYSTNSAFHNCWPRREV